MTHTRLAFSLVELMIVIALCAILISCSIAINNYLYKIAVRSEVKKLYHYCMHACAKAILTQQDQIIEIDCACNSYGLTHESKKQQLSPRTQFGFVQGTLGPPSASDTILQSACSFNNAKIVCSPSGTLSSGAVYLIDRERRYMYALSSSVADVSLVRIYYHDGKKWVLL